MRSCLVALTLFAAALPANAAPQAVFPYEATVEVETTLVRSGPGSKYYPTSRLKQGERVVVQRHDPGGWHMIAPPAGSFSWIPARYVDKASADRGTVNTNNVAVRVGSFESDIRELFHRKLSQGDEVRILSEKSLDPETGTGPKELWYRIAPPRGEWRWIAGQALSPAPRDSDGKPGGAPFGSDPAGGQRKRTSPPTQPIDDEGFEQPVHDVRFEQPAGAATNREYHDNQPPAGVEERPITRRSGHLPAGKLPSEPSSSDQQRADGPQKLLAAQLEELDRLDARFRSILDREPLEWDFGELEQDYHRLHDQTESTSIRQMIDKRLSRIVDYGKTRAEQEELAKVAAETDRRDSELADVQRRQEARLAGLKQPRFDGAGIVQRAALNRKGAPGHALTTPTGKVLAYLLPGPGVNLDAWVGRPAGVNGRRIPSPELKADLITVLFLTPVRLAQ
ncbi:MAG: hypothetical protein EXS05_22715 [Planctomycetaceae bacterium]|nr:hypothetical protein [Planctomycetaceae bacterium]